jgi:hypothetical protein
MSTNLPQLATEQLSGMPDQFKRTILKRGSYALSLTDAVTNSTGYSGAVSIDITDTYIQTTTSGGLPTFVLPKAEVSAVWTQSGSGYPVIVPLPQTRFTTSNAIEFNGYYSVSYSVNVIPTERLYVNLNVFLRASNTLIAAYTDVATIYYTIYSEGSYAFDNWDYKS